MPARYTAPLYASKSVRIRTISTKRDCVNVPSQLVTASFQSFTSCSRVPPKCSTNSGPKTDASRAILLGCIILIVADSKEVGNILTYGTKPLRRVTANIDAHKPSHFSYLQESNDSLAGQAAPASFQCLVNQARRWRSMQNMGSYRHQGRALPALWPLAAPTEEILCG